MKLLALARQWQAQLESGEIKTQAEIAARSGLHPYRVSNILCLLRLDGAILEHIEGLPVGTPSRYLNERWLRPLTRLSRDEQLAAVFGRSERKESHAAPIRESRRAGSMRIVKSERR